MSMNFSYEKAMLEVYKEAFNMIANGDRDVKDNAKDAFNFIQHQEMLLKEKETMSRLEGTHYYTNLLGVKTVNLLERYLESERSSFDQVEALVKEFIPKELSHLEEGGTSKINLENRPYLKEKLEEVESGTYRIPDTNKNAICIRVPGINFGLIVFILPENPQDKVKMIAITYLESEKDWITHQHFSVYNRKAVRVAMVDFITRQGNSLSNFISKDSLLKTIKEKGIVDEVLKEEIYTLKIKRDEGIKIFLFKHSEEVSWDKLNTTKQNQFYARLLTL